MGIKNSFKMAFSSIWAKKLRSFLTMLGIIIGVASVIILVSIMSGVTGQVTETFDSIGATSITVSAMGRGDTRKIAPEDLYTVVDENPDLFSGMSPKVTVSGYNIRSTNSSDSISATVNGVSEDYVNIAVMTVEQGRFLQYIDIAKLQKVCVIGTYVEQELFGRGQALGKTLKINGNPLTVIGVLEETAESAKNSADAIIYLPYTVASRMNGTTVISSYTVAALNESVIDSAVTALEKHLGGLLGDDNSFTVVAMKEILNQMEEIMGILSAALVAIAGISLLVGGIGIMNIMLVTVTERTREIGIRKALGAKNRLILTQFVIEAATVSGLGGLLGIGTGVGVAYLVGNLLDMPVSPTLNAIALSFGVSVSIGILFGFLPAKKASALNPIDALRYE